MISGKKQTIRLFTYAQLIILILFTIVTIFAVYRLSNLGYTLENLANESMPNIAKAASFTNRIQSLSTLTSILTGSTSNPARQLAKQKVDKSIQLVNQSLLGTSDANSYLTRQLATLTQEINELDTLVEQRILQEHMLLKSREKFTYEFSKLFQSINTNIADNKLENKLLDILLLAMQIDQQTRMHALRQIESELAKKLKNAIDGVASSQINTKASLTDIQTHLIGNDGLVTQKIQFLKIVGRTRGRDSFVRNLIANVSSNLDYQNQLTNQSTLQAANKANDSATEYANITVIVGLFSFLLTLGIIYFLYKKIVSRLISLAQQVEMASEHNSTEIHINGNDEISQLAERFSLYLARMKEQESALLNMTLTDPLTAIPNRRAFEAQLKETMAIARRNEWWVSLFLVDIDFFKDYNDHYGHSEGDACLRLVANEIHKIMARNTDFCARFGGEEFVCILPNTNPNGAKLKAEAVRKAIMSLSIPHAKSAIGDTLTVSIGSGSFLFTQHDNWMSDIIFEQTDKALYKAKRNGRNQCDFFAIDE
ncbi:diguanylate cyclase [Glaciecola petra]|uniref:diguanylate cyclase n=1 Tax=Glaciecola petra TaxID=3075602 RepID=A0ABU2ZLP8_9ALTE|nr:diguanylate cyclase [Aestuariibacter sp. P117]MDT0593551.1 diguanylate cyclase [Aestuariibacter sp. P117]